MARILLGPAWHVQAPPNLAFDDFPRLLDAGIDDWGGVSPVTIDHVNPEAPWPEIERLAEATRSRGLELAPRLPLYPEYVADLERWVDPGRRAARPPRVRRDGPRARRRLGAGRAGRGAVRRPPRRVAARAHGGDELGEDELTRLLEARGGGGAARVRGRRPPASRGLRRRGHATSSRGTSSTRTSATSAAASARSRRGSWPRTCAARPTSSRSRRSSAAREEAWDARRDRGLPAGRDPPGVHGRLLRGGRPGDQARPSPGSTCTRSRRSRCGRVRRRSASRSRTTSGACATSGSARSRARLQRSSTTRCAGSSAPTRSRRPVARRCTTPRIASACART